jgi:hypothetical protein
MVEEVDEQTAYAILELDSVYAPVHGMAQMFACMDGYLCLADVPVSITAQ